MNRRTIGVTLASLLLAAAQTAAAQDAPRPLFFEGAFTIEMVGLSSGRQLAPVSQVLVEQETGDSVAGGAFAVGSWLAPKVSVRIGASFFAAAKSHAEYVSTDTLGTVLPGVPTTIRQTQITDEETKRQSIDVLVGYHVRHARWSIGYLAGVAFTRQRQHIVDILKTDLPPVLLESVLVSASETYETELTLFDTKPIVGLDLSLQLAPNLAIVPQVRLAGGNGSISTRFGASVRWTP